MEAKPGQCDYCPSEARYYFQDLKDELKIKACEFHGDEIRGRLSE